jgi:hypothetical protein
VDPQLNGLNRNVDVAATATPKGSANATDRNLSEARKVLARATEAALSEDGVDGLVALLSRQDRARIAPSAGAQPDTADDGAGRLRDRVRQFRQSWREKYGRDFGVKNEQVVFSGVRVDAASPADGDTATAATNQRSNGGELERAQAAGARLGRSGGSEAGVEDAPARDAATFEKRVDAANRDDARSVRAESPDASSPAHAERSKPGDAEAPRAGRTG